jgi:serine/threonine protein kinase
MGIVYEAQDRSLERRVAVKKMRDEIRVDPHERRRFVNEAKLVAQLRHPNIVDIYAIVEEGQEVYLVFEFVSGRTLGDQLKSEGPMSLDAARNVLHAASEAVEHAHAAQIVHRDLKPSNIMITDDGRVKVMDFGVARQAKDAITKMSMTNTVVGTPPYMAPEQEQGTVRRESDVFALGVCLYEMLTGHLPFTGGGAAMLLNKLNGKHIPPSQRNPELPAGLDEVLAKALIPDPDKRYHTPSEFVAALDAVIARSA